MIFEGNIEEDGGLGVIVAQFLCYDLDIKAPIPFYIDTGCTRTTLSQMDTLNANIPIDKLEKSKSCIMTGIGDVYPYIIHSCAIVLEQDHNFIKEYLGEVFVLNSEQPDTLSRSTLGLDILYKYKISFDEERRKVILER